MKKENAITAAFHLYRSSLLPQQIALELRVHKFTVYLWIQDLRHLGLDRSLHKRSRTLSREYICKIRK